MAFGGTLQQYLNQVYQSILEKDGMFLAPLLSSCHPHVHNPKLRVQGYEIMCRKVVGSPFDEIVAAHLKAVECVNNGDYIGSYTAQSVVVQSFNKILLTQKDENWGIPVLITLIRDLRELAVKADKQMTVRGKGRPGDIQEKAAEILMSSFRVCVTDLRAAREQSKKWGTLPVINQLFKVYFKINKLNLMKPLIRAVEQSNLRNECQIGQLVTYSYFVGRKAIFDSDFKAADENLTFAFERCHRAAKRNKRRILTYLIPVKMLLGQIPSYRLLQKYSLLEFAGIATALQQGNVLALNGAIDRNEKFFIQCGTYLILEKLTVLAYRNLFKRVYLLLGTHQIPLGIFCDALKMMEVSVCMVPVMDVKLLSPFLPYKGGGY
jgi:hypothetical protein